MDQALYPGNYHDYADDEVAIQRELEIGDGMLENNFIDEVFPPNSKSLYFDALNPPKGGIPNDSIKWLSISEGEILNCENPVFFNEDMYSCRIIPGAIGNSYLLNTLALLSCQPKFIHRLLVSSKFASRGLYTFKFHKNGKWRYVHIDDFIPCRQSGNVHCLHNYTPNETFAMLIEKAYAKLHGCYEALTNGLIEELLLEFTPGAGVTLLRLDRMPKKSLCDEVWEKMDKAVSKNSLIGCGRFVPDPMTENPGIRKGIPIGALFHVVDLCISSAEPTEDFDAVTVGMVCIRTLQADTVRYTGRWSYGHHLWLNYKEIALDLRQRTREIQFKRGLGPNPASEDFDAQQEAMVKTKDLDNEDNEYDDLDLTYQQASTTGLANKVMIQPIAEDLQWIQIEDFVNIFNYIYIVHDISFEKRVLCKRFTSQWLPGDYLVGSGGPPVVVYKEPIEDQEEDRPVSPGASIENTSVDKPKEKVVKYKKVAQINDTFTDNPMYPFTVTEPTRMYITLYQPDKRWNVQGRLGSNPRGVQSNVFLSRKQRLETVMQYDNGIAFVICRLSGLKMRITEFKLKKMTYTSQLLVFANAVNQVIDIFPGRYVIIPYTHSILDRVLDYAIHIQYYANHVDFEVEDVVAQRLEDKDVSLGDDNADNEPEDNELLVVHPDKYKIPSAGSGEQKGDGDGAAADEDDVVSVMSYEPISNVQQADDLDKDDEDDEGNDEQKEMTTKLLPPPRVYRHPRFEFADDIEEVGMGGLFSEVGSMMNYVKTLKQEVDRLNGTIRALNRSQSMHNQQHD